VLVPLNSCAAFSFHFALAFARGTLLICGSPLRKSRPQGAFLQFQFQTEGPGMVGTLLIKQRMDLGLATAFVMHGDAVICPISRPLAGKSAIQ
jgi:hypothetical protein